MKKLKLGKTGTRLKIVGATGSAIFSLFSMFAATLAWLAASTGATASGMQVAIVSSGSAYITDLNLVKFDYGRTTIPGSNIEMIDYLTPATGDVSKYDYCYTTHSFGRASSGVRYYQWDGSKWDITVEAPETGENKGTVASALNLDGVSPAEDDYYQVTNGVWNAVEATNPYDPVERVIRNADVREMNCNAVYEVVFESSSTATFNLMLKATLFAINDMGANDILLSDCVDIDLFMESDLLDNNALFTQQDDQETALVNEFDDKLYYPSYKLTDNKHYYLWQDDDWVESAVSPDPEIYTNKGTVRYEYCLPESPADGDFYQVLKTPVALSELETLYYKISYLSSLVGENNHSHFYGNSKQSNITIDTVNNVSFTVGVPVKFYINVNLAPSKADKYMDSISLANIRARFDYYFDFAFSTVGGGA